MHTMHRARSLAPILYIHNNINQLENDDFMKRTQQECDMINKFIKRILFCAAHSQYYLKKKKKRKEKDKNHRKLRTATATATAIATAPAPVTAPITATKITKQKQ